MPSKLLIETHNGINDIIFNKKIDSLNSWPKSNSIIFSAKIKEANEVKNENKIITLEAFKIKFIPELMSFLNLNAASGYIDSEIGVVNDFKI